MKRLCYRTGFKGVSAVCQGILAGVLALCIMTVSYWMEGNARLSELGKEFEQTRVFLERAESIVRKKVACDENRDLFERGGQYDEMKEIDIHQYISGMQDTANINVNTSYYMGELLMFGRDGAAVLEARLRELAVSGRTDEEIGRLLSEEASVLETVQPISGSSLADFADLSTTPGTTLLEYYEYLCITGQELYRRFQKYEQAKQEINGEENSSAPSNVRYYIENVNTKKRYTNLNAKSFPAAQAVIANDEDLEFLFEGERSFNIMIANSEHVMNDETAQWFIDKQFTGSGEKVILAIDGDYPISDSLQRDHLAFLQREPVLLACAVMICVSILIMTVLFIICICFTGIRERGGNVQLFQIDRIPAEICAGLCLIGAIVWYYLLVWLNHQYPLFTRRLLIPVGAAGEYWICFAGFMSLVRRIRTKSLWSNSVCYVVVRGCRQVYNAKRSSGILLFSYLVFFVLNFVFLRFFGIAGNVMAVVTDMTVLLYLMRDSVGKQVVREGLYQISQGHLDYRIDTSALIGDSMEMGEAVNEMGDGLARAVDSMLQNERLKAELITNVSHDIKTPLTSIINYVDLLKREKLDNQKAQEYLAILEQKSHRLKQLTEDLIEVSKISSGNVELHMMCLEVRAMIRQAYGELAERLEERGLEMFLDMEPDPIYIMADGSQLWRVLENLLTNAAKYALENTRVDMTVARRGETVLIECRNRSARKLETSGEELQERFVRGDRSRNTEGSGLGLSIAGSLTRLMGGMFDIVLDGEYFSAQLVFPLVSDGDIDSLKKTKQ